MFLSFLPEPLLSLDFHLSDKLYHVLAYGTVMLWLAQLYPKSRYVWLACGLITLGVVTEIVQLQLPGREGDGWDIVANSLGAVVGWSLAFTGKNTLLYQFENWCLSFCGKY